MPSKSEDWNFGPSKPYLRAKNLSVGDSLTFRLISIEEEDVDTDFGPKVQMTFNVLTSSTPQITPGEYVWNTVCSAARQLRASYIRDKIDLKDVRTLCLSMEEDGMRIKVFQES
jgi:hypothetical protein